MRVAVAFDHAVRRAALAACLSSDDTSITALADRSQRWPRGREQMRRRGVATVAATAGSSQPIKAQSLVSVLIYQSETRSPTGIPCNHQKHGVTRCAENGNGY